MTSRLRKRRPLKPVEAPRPPSLITSFKLNLEAWNAGARPNTIPVSSDTRQSETQHGQIDSNLFHTRDGEGHKVFGYIGHQQIHAPHREQQARQSAQQRKQQTFS